MNRTVVCGVDHSPLSDVVVEAAAALAGGIDVRLLLAHSRQASAVPLGRVAPHPGFAGWPPLEPDAELRADELLEALAAHGPAGTTDTAVLDDEPGRALCTLAERARARFVVVGSRGRGPLRALVLGSVSATVIRHAPCPVVVVPEAASAVIARPLLDGTSVLCGIGSQHDRPLAGLAAELAVALGLPLRLVHVRPPTREVTAGAMGPESDERIAAGAALLQGLADEVVDAHPPLAGLADWSLCTGDVAPTLTELAASTRAAALVVGTDSDGGLARALRPSPAWELARHAPVPVVVARGGAARTR